MLSSSLWRYRRVEDDESGGKHDRFDGVYLSEGKWNCAQQIRLDDEPEPETGKASHCVLKGPFTGPQVRTVARNRDCNRGEHTN